MARTIITLDESNIDLILSGNTFALKVDQRDKEIHICGKLVNGATFIIDGVEETKQDYKYKQAKHEDLITPVIANPLDELDKTIDEQLEKSDKEPVEEESFGNKRLHGMSVMKTNEKNIMIDLVSGIMQKEIAKKYGVHQSTICNFYKKHYDEIQRMKKMGIGSNEDIKEEQKENTFIDSDTEAEIISKLIDNTPILKLSRDYNVPKEVVQTIYIENKAFIENAMKSKLNQATTEQLENLVKEFSNR